MCDSHLLGALLGRCAHLSRERLDARLTQYDVTPAQIRVLLYIHHHGGQVPQCEVIKHLKVKPSTANGILYRMEEKGFVTRSVSDSDARYRLIRLTEKGERQQTEFRRLLMEVESLMTQGWTPEERELFVRLLDKIVENLEEDRTV